MVFELPEFVTLSKQINAVLKGQAILRGELGNSPQKFLWYNKRHDEFRTLTREKVIGEVWAKWKWLFIPLDPGYLLLFGVCGGVFA